MPQRASRSRTRKAVADLPSEFWGGWIATITVASFVALLWLVIDVYRSGPDGNEQQVWDETLREGAKPAPIWWFWFILALMIDLGDLRDAVSGPRHLARRARLVHGRKDRGAIRRLRRAIRHTAQAHPRAAARRARQKRLGHAIRLARVQQQLQLLPRPRRGRAGPAVSGPDGCRLAMGLGRIADRRRRFMRAARPRCPAGLDCWRSTASTSLPIMCWRCRAARPHRPRRHPAARCSSSTAWPAMASAAKAIRCSAHRHSMTRPGTTVASAPT